MSDVKELNINNTTYDIKAKSVVDTNSGKLRFWTGTRTQYDAIATKDSNTLYWLTDAKITYLGNNAIGNFKGGRNIGELVYSSLPLTDAGLHLLDGARLSSDGIYKGFVDYVAELYNDTKVYNPSAFTVVGSPTITDDGVASGFSSSNYVTVPNLNLENADTWEIEGIVNVVSNTSTSAGTWLSPRTGNGLMLPCVYSQSGGNIQYQLYLSSTNSSWDIATDSSISFPSGHTVKCNLKFTGTQYIYTCTDLDTNVVKNKIINSTAKVYQSPTQIGLKRNETGLTGSIDLKQFKVTVDGKEVFNGSTPANYFTTEASWQQSVTTYGSCGKFVYDSVSKTVRLPKISDILQSTTDINALGDLVEAGLPNITGTFCGGDTAIATGAFTSLGNNSSPVGSGNSRFKSFDFDASRSSSIYGNSTTVQPQTIKAFVYIVIANSTKTSIQVDIDKIATDLNNKAGTDLANVTDTGKILMSGMGMPSDKYIDLTLGASGSTYTAPANGYFYIHGDSYDNSNFHAITVFYNSANSWDTPVIRITQPAKLAGAADLIPVKKGQTIRIEFSDMTMRPGIFVYAVGSESEAN